MSKVDIKEIVMDTPYEDSPLIFQTQYRTWEVLLFIPAVSIFTFMVEDEVINSGSMVAITLAFLLIALIYMKKLILYKNRVYISHPFAKFRDKIILLNDIETIENTGEYREFLIILKSGLKIKLSIVLMRKFPEFQKQLNNILDYTSNPED
ncbi:MAG: hypothetical protein ACI9ZT_001903 [Gammaproteobacteria bacterium]|jgi:hypothetical protein